MTKLVGRGATRDHTASDRLVAVLILPFVALAVASCAAGPAPVRATSPAPSGSDLIGTLPAPDAGSGDGSLPVDVVVGDRLLRAGGGEISLAGLVCDSCFIGGAWRTGEGWLMSQYEPAASGPGTWTLWRVSESGAASAVVAGNGRLLVSAGTEELPGIRVAWVADGRLHLGRYGDGAVNSVVSTPAPTYPIDDQFGARPLFPQALVGDAVVLAGTHTGAGLGFWDVWHPGRGDYVRETSESFVDLYGITADRQRIIGSYLRYPGSGSKDLCLGEVRAEDFTPVRSVCPAPAFELPRIYPSPDGRWWMLVEPSRLSLYEAAQVWSGGAPVRSWPITATPGVWLDPSSFVVLDAEGALTLYTDGRPEAAAPVDLPPPSPARPATIVVDLGGAL